MPVRVRTGQIFSNALDVIAINSYADQGVLSSSIQQVWTITYGSTLETRVRYTPSDVFETLPRHAPTDELERAGRSLDAERREVMLRRDLGLTRLYNLVNDPDVRDASDHDVARLRQIHVELDHAVMAAYGWENVPLEHGFHEYRQVRRWTVSSPARLEILERLLDENHHRAAIQVDAPRPLAEDEDGDDE